MCFILCIAISIFNGERISKYIEYLQVFELCFFIRAAPEVRNDFFKGTNQIITNGKYVEFVAVVQSIEDHDFIVIQG